MEIKLKWPFEHEGLRYEKVRIPECLQLGHRRLYAKAKSEDQEEMGISLCAALCEIPLPAFDKVSIEDFERITDAVRILFGSVSQKKENFQRKNGTSRKR